jgi:hypothetical protein
MPRIAAVLVLLALPGAAAAATPADWKAYADCAAAYRANAAIDDPARGKAMRASIADEAEVYAKAAVAPYRHATKAGEAKARRVVTAYVAGRTPDFARQSREAIDHFIDACPQTEN